MFGGKKKDTEVFTKAYVEKANLTNVQVHPAPIDLENWIEIDFDANFSYKRKKYDIATGTFVTDTAQEDAAIMYRRKQAYKERSDEMFMEWQFDNTPQSEAAWRAEVTAIKAKFPKN